MLWDGAMDVVPWIPAGLSGPAGPAPGQLLGEPALAGLVPLGAWHSLRAPTRQQQGQNWDESLDLPQHSAFRKGSGLQLPPAIAMGSNYPELPELPGDAGWEQRAGVMPLGTLAYKGRLHFKECHQNLSLNTFKFWNEE